MRDLNNVILTGRLGKDIELKTTGSGKYVTTFSLAVNFDDKTDWILCKAWDKAAEALSKFSQRGDHLTIAGRLVTREYEHNDETRKITEVVVDRIVFPDRKSEGMPSVSASDYKEQMLPDADSDELPF